MFVDVFPIRLYVPAIKLPLSVKVKAIPYANLRILASYWWSLDKGVLMQMSFAIDWQVTRSFILHSFTPKSNVENRPTCKHNPNCDNVGMTLLFHTANLQF